VFFDEEYPESEQLPRELKVSVAEEEVGKIARLRLLPEGVLIGDQLTDNAYDDDGYRYHDVMHLAHMAVLGWSPVLRRFLKRKRKSNPTVDDVEDGGRAAILEELIVAFVYANARERRNYDAIKHLDSEMLSTIRRLVSHLEVRKRRTQDWERAILQGYAAFRHLIQNRRAILSIDLRKRELKVVE
jgi:hypothetical protein